jgi:hypothetical protein
MEFKFELLGETVRLVTRDRKPKGALGCQASCRYVAGGMPTSRLNALRKATGES